MIYVITISLVLVSFAQYSYGKFLREQLSTSMDQNKFYNDRYDKLLEKYQSLKMKEEIRIQRFEDERGEDVYDDGETQSID